MVGPNSFAKFTFTAARSVIITQPYNNKNENTIHLLNNISKKRFSLRNKHMKRKRFEYISRPQSFIEFPNLFRSKMLSTKFEVI